MLNNQSSYFDQIHELYPSKQGRSIKDVTFQVTEDCNLQCTYCYQHNKTHNKMTFETAKKFIDYIFESKYEKDSFFSQETTKGLVIDFIGGEPFLELDLISQIIDYFEFKFLEDNDEDWILFHNYNFSSNGTLYFTEKSQKFLQKYKDIISMNITVDGNKQLHDACRLFSDGTGSYDLAHAAALDQLNKGNLGNKITLSPFNVEYLFDGIKTFIEDGFRYINMNCCFEDVWNKDSALKLFEQLILLSDWITENDLYDKLYVAMLSSASYFPVNDSILEHGWCGVGSKNMISLDYKGILYPCIRFMPSSLGNEREPLTLGDLNNGLLQTEKDKQVYNMLANGTRKLLSNEECLKCPIASGCSWCIGYCYEYYGDTNKKTNFICEPYKMAALASKYLSKKNNDKISFNNINLDYSMYKDLINEKEFNKINKWEEEE